MSIFVCSQCGYLENTALSGYWFRRGSPPLCSECDPRIGKWHDRFPKEKFDDKKYQIINGFVEELE